MIERDGLGLRWWKLGMIHRFFKRTQQKASTVMSPFARDYSRYELKIPLTQEFRFAHEPIRAEESQRFVGRQTELEGLAERILFSEGGSFLVTGYRGVGKTSFVNQVVRKLREALPWAEPVLGKTEVLDVQLSVARPLQPAELMHHIIRRLYHQLVDKGIYQLLSNELKEDLTLAYYRTSVNMTRKMAEASERSFGFNEMSLGSDNWKATLKASWLSKRSRSEDYQFAFLGYDDKAAEHDIMQISRKLSAGYQRESSWKDRVQILLGQKARTSRKLKIVFIFDELDKLEEFAGPDGSSTRLPIDDMLSALKNLFTTSGISFVFVAGKDLQERWLEDIGRGDSVYESIFSFDKYLSCMWANVGEICDRFVDWSAIEDGLARQIFEDFKKYLNYKGRGIPRRIIRGFNEYVQWYGQTPFLLFSRQEIRSIRFYATLQDVLAQNNKQLFGSITEDALGTQQDKNRLGVYYLVDWILRQSSAQFTLQNAIYASKRLSAKIAPAEEIAPRIIVDIMDVLLDNDYIEEVHKELDHVQIGDIDGNTERRYKLTPRRLAEMGGRPDVFEEESYALAAEGGRVAKIGHYSVLEKIGSGGMGIVCRAWDEHKARLVALKILPSSLTSDPQAIERFRREARIMSSLHHPNIVQYNGMGSEKGQLYIVMDYIDGIDLRIVLQHRHRLDLHAAVEIGISVAEALRYIHSQGFARNDIKPGNVMINRTGQVYLLDFGITKPIIEDARVITNFNTPIGTPYYMAPEQCEGKPVDARADIYSFGAMFYEMLTGRRPFEAESAYATMQAHIHQEPVPPSRYVDISKEIDALILKCLEKTPSKRFQSMADLVGVLNQASCPQVPDYLSKIVKEVDRMVRETEEKKRRGTQTLKALGEFEEQLVKGGFVIAPQPPALYQTIGVPESDLIDGSHLIALNGPIEAGAILKLQDGKTSLGRAEDNSIVLAGLNVSRYHTLITSNEDGCLIEDMNSANGTILNGALIKEPRQLKDKDKIQITDIVFEFRQGRDQNSRARGARVEKLS